MRVPIEWLHEYCAPALATPALAERLAMTGTEVERVEHHGVRALEHFVVGLVLEAERHPRADRLTVCVVDIGDHSPAQIVCGAPNVASGQLVAVARPGAVMPDGTTLKAVELRGIESQGMILAEDELGIGTEHAGIMVLDEHGSEGVVPGSPLATVMPIWTDVLALEITPNRPDCLSIYGVAREAHAATAAPLQAPPWAQDPGSEGDVDTVAVEVDCLELCRRFTARAFEDVRIGPSPAWLKARLMAAGQRPISNVVDITNYVMLLTGQPLHAFDLDQIAGAALTVRRAQDGEQIRTIDGQTRVLDGQMVIIEDADGPTSIAGVMGGERSEVSPSTTRVLIEAATWDGPNIHRTAKRLGLRSEASNRFEKQTQPEQALEGQAVASRLMAELCGARLIDGTVDIGSPGPEPRRIHLRDARVESLLGAAVERHRSVEILTALGFSATDTDADDGLDIEVPAFRRADVTREVDLIEEVARLGALETLPATLPSRHGASGRLTPRQRLRRTATDVLAARGMHEIVGWSFVAPDLPHRLRLGQPNHDRRQPVELKNPISGAQSRLRTTLLGSLLDAARHNRAHGAATIRLFESGAVYHGRPEGLPDEPYYLAALATGPVHVPTWRDPHPPRADFFAIKAVLGALLDSLGVTWSLERTLEPFLHPGRAAALRLDGEPAGWVGEIHPLVAGEWEINDTVAAFELDLDAVPEPPTAIYVELPSFPDVREDLAVIVPQRVAAAQVLATIRRAGAPLLAGAEVFDVYHGAQAGAGHVSLALALSYRAPDRTLTDEEVARQREAILAALADELEGRVRVA